jgi:hypothetical protein
VEPPKGRGMAESKNVSKFEALRERAKKLGFRLRKIGRRGYELDGARCTTLGGVEWQLDFQDGARPMQVHRASGNFLIGLGVLTNFKNVAERYRREGIPPKPPGYEWFDRRGRVHRAKTKAAAARKREKARTYEERKNMAKPICNDCGVNVLKIGEYYMLKGELWEKRLKLGWDDNLCIGCLEARLGRKVTIGDMAFLPAYRWMYPRSDRLTARIGPRVS